MRLKITSLLATAALALTACGSSTDECAEVMGQGGLLPAAEALAAAEACVPGTVADFVDNVGDRVFFDFDRSAVRPDGMEILQRQAAWLNTYGNYVVTINGHCDKRGTVEYNLALGERRAHAAREKLIAFGVDPARIRVVSYGKNRPIVEQDNAGDLEWAFQQNRVAITVLD
ncbi:MAG: OmpA family protein [Alphaproteobacteria bacterium]|jgi:peptidoglycan-associated lipoprotein|nr:OmpA family protein [Alphaproteobacteria bacterium]MBP7729192.1 OmpA family protein [Alphaproteobacteria bacterium]